MRIPFYELREGFLWGIAEDFPVGGNTFCLE
jgi:hypothetical protein